MEKILLVQDLNIVNGYYHNLNFKDSKAAKRLLFW